MVLHVYFRDEKFRLLIGGQKIITHVFWHVVSTVRIVSDKYEPELYWLLLFVSEHRRIKYKWKMWKRNLKDKHIEKNTN